MTLAVNSDRADLDRVLHALAEAPRRIGALTHGVAEVRLQRQPEPGVWSMNEILDHLRACADIWGASIALMLAESRPVRRYVSPRSRVKERRYADLEFQVSLQEYAIQRAELVERLRGLAPADWLREGTFAGGSRPKVETVRTYCQRIVDHEAEHLAHIENTLALSDD